MKIFVPTNRAVSIFDVPFKSSMLETAVSECQNLARQSVGGYVCFVNVHSLTESIRNFDLRRSFIEARYNFTDGMPLVWTSRLKVAGDHGRVYGPGFMKRFLETSTDWTHGFIGGQPRHAEDIRKNFGIDVISYSPPMRTFSEQNAKEDWQQFLEVCQRLNKPVPKAIWVGLGAPKQELWMHAVSPLAQGVMFFGVGAAFDFLSGTKKQAPSWMQKAGLEWVYRLIQEPRRLWSRYLTTNLTFLFLLPFDLMGFHVSKVFKR